jgi:RNA polymerase sigma factor (sigma-70 family)
MGVTKTEKAPPEPVLIGWGRFEDFYRQYRPRLVALAFALSGSRLGADDLAHDVLEAAYRDWDRIRDLDEPVAWVRRMVANRAVSVYRRRLAEVRAVARLAARRESAAFPEPGVDADRIWREVRRLPRRQAQAIVLTYLEQLTMAEVAEVLGCSKESVNTHLRRGRETLSRRLGWEKHHGTS